MIEVPGSDRLPTYSQFLKEVPLFSALTPQQLAGVINDFRARIYRKGNIIFHQGDTSQTVYVVMQGKVRVYHLSPDGKETTVAIFPPRQVLGEFSVLDRQPRSATAQAITACVLLEISAERCLFHLEHISGLALAMCRQLVYKARRTSLYAEAIARYDAAGRLLHFLLLYNKEFGLEVEPGKRYELDLGLGQGDLATLVGAQRQWVNRLLGSWRRRGLIAFNNDGKITILDMPQIEAERDSRMQGQPIE